MRKEDMNRLNSPKMEYYHWAYGNSPRWNGKDPLLGKHVIVYCEQGFGDTIQFSRYFSDLKKTGCRITAHCRKPLHQLLSGMADDFFDDEDEVPSHDYHVLSMSLPFLLDKIDDELPDEAYIKVSEVEDLKEHNDFFKIGIAWEGNPDHSNNIYRSCPLKWFKLLSGIKGVRLFMLQNQINTPSLINGAEDLELFSVPIKNFYDTAKLMNAMDLVISVDTAILHLAGALNKPAYGLLSTVHDYRWNVSNWYKSIKLISQKELAEWEFVFEELLKDMGQIKDSDGIELDVPRKHSILLTGGIGDVITLESFLSNEERERIDRIFYATRAWQSVDELFDVLGDKFPSVSIKATIWDDFSKKFCFYCKSDLSETLKTPPDGWNDVSDWSIFTKFPEIENNKRTYTGSSLLKTCLAPISQFNLPDNYVVIVPDSANKAFNRQFTGSDWGETTRFLVKNKLMGVILRVDGPTIPDHPCFIDLTGKTSLIESIEILKAAKGYIGIDSCLSVLAAKLFDRILAVKSVNSHLTRWKEIYYAPKKDFSFINQKIILPDEASVVRSIGKVMAITYL